MKKICFFLIFFLSNQINCMEVGAAKTTISTAYDLVRLAKTVKKIKQPYVMQHTLQGYTIEPSACAEYMASLLFENEKCNEKYVGSVVTTDVFNDLKEKNSNGYDQAILEIINKEGKKKKKISCKDVITKELFSRKLQQVQDKKEQIETESLELSEVKKGFSCCKCCAAFLSLLFCAELGGLIGLGMYLQSCS